MSRGSIIASFAFASVLYVGLAEDVEEANAQFGMPHCILTSQHLIGGNEHELSEYGPNGLTKAACQEASVVKADEYAVGYCGMYGPGNTDYYGAGSRWYPYGGGPEYSYEPRPPLSC